VLLQELVVAAVVRLYMEEEAQLVLVVLAEAVLVELQVEV
tara:strand:+ start:591 stop:710 length:120 start_codon:yes stop_codon:yes gene_type:complete